jgi:hypothetical protein
MQNKRGIIGSFVGMFFATIFVVIVLILFVLAAGAVKEFSNVREGQKTLNNWQLGIADIKYSLVDYSILVSTEAKALRSGDFYGKLAFSAYKDIDDTRRNFYFDSNKEFFIIGLWGVLYV